MLVDVDGASDRMAAWIVRSGVMVSVCRIGATEEDDAAATAEGLMVAVTTLCVVVSPLLTILK